MTQEIIYTSAPSGLKPGSRGFCTVVATRGLAKPLADQLEDLSGYRHIFVSNDANSALNPIIFSHLKLSIAGRTYHVVSRICDAGLDYTQRTNKLAHHVALEPRELTPGGPAALLSTPGFMTTSWSGEPAIRESGPVPSTADLAPGVCREWGRLTGDPGWGGFIAEALVADARKQVVLVYRPGTNVLALVAETLALLPANRRWDVTFCTYFTKLPPTVDCRWRCVVDGTPEAETLARSPTAIVIDLRKPLVPPAGSTYVSAARTGVPVSQAVASPAPIRSPGATAQSDQDDLLLAALCDSATDDSVRTRSKNEAPNREPLNSAISYGLAPPPISNSDLGGTKPSHGMRQNQRIHRTVHPAILISFALFAMITLGGLGSYLYLILNKTPQELAATPVPQSDLIAEPKNTAPETRSHLPASTPSPTPPINDATRSGTVESKASTVKKSESPPSNNVADKSAATAAVSEEKSAPNVVQTPANAPAANQETESVARPPKELQYFAISSLSSADSSLGNVADAANYDISLLLNDEVKASSSKDFVITGTRPNSKDWSIALLQSPPPGSGLTPVELAIFAIVRPPEAGTAHLRFVRRHQLSHSTDALRILQSSVIEVRGTPKGRPAFTQRFQVKPQDAKAINLSAFSDKVQELPAFPFHKKAPLIFRVWIEIKGQPLTAIETSKGVGVRIEYPIDSTFNVPLITTFLDAPGDKIIITQEIDSSALREQDLILYDEGLIPFSPRSLRLDPASLSVAEKRLDVLLKSRSALVNEKRTLLDQAKGKTSSEAVNAAQKEVDAAESLFNRTELSVKRTKLLKGAYTDILDAKTSSAYKVHVEVLNKVGDANVTLLTTDSAKYQ